MVTGQDDGNFFDYKNMTNLNMYKTLPHILCIDITQHTWTRSVWAGAVFLLFTDTSTGHEISGVLCKKTLDGLKSAHNTVTYRETSSLLLHVLASLIQ